MHFLWEGVAKRRGLLLQMLKDERTQRREDGVAVSSSDDERDMRRVDAQIEGSGGRGIALGQDMKHTSHRRTRDQNKDLESMFLDDEGDKRLLNLCITARASGSAILLAYTRSASSGGMQTYGHAILWEGVAKRRELLLQMLKDERTQRREDGVAVSSSDEERDMRRVDAQLEGNSSQGALLAARKKNRRRRREERQGQKQQQRDLEGTLFHHSANKARLSLFKQSTLLTLDSEKQTTSYTESFRVKGVPTDFTASSHSYDPKILKQIAKQKELLQAAGYMAFQSENGQEELKAVAAKTQKMRNFWTSFSLSRADVKPGNSVSFRKDGTYGGIEAEFVVGSEDNLRRVNVSKSCPQLHVHGSVRGLDHIESAALIASSKKMRKFWQAVDAKSKENSPDRRVLLHNCAASDEEVRKLGILLMPWKAAIARAAAGCRMLLCSPDCKCVDSIRDSHASGAQVLEGITLSVDVGIDDGVMAPESSGTICDGSQRNVNDLSCRTRCKLNSPHDSSGLADAETLSPFFSLQSPSQSQLFNARSFSQESSPTRYHYPVVSLDCMRDCAPLSLNFCLGLR